MGHGLGLKFMAKSPATESNATPLTDIRLPTCNLTHGMPIAVAVDAFAHGPALATHRSPSGNL